MQEYDELNWGQLGFPEMPKWLHGITSPNEVIREQSYNDMHDNRVAHLSDASPHVAHFLTELLVNDQVQDLESHLLLLMQMASNADMYKYQENATALAQRTLLEISKGIETYLAYLKSDIAVGVILELFYYLSGQITEAVPDLISILETTKDDNIKASIFYVLGRLVKDTIDDDLRMTFGRQLIELLNIDQSSTLRFANAWAVVYAFQDLAPQNVKDFFLDSLAQVPVSDNIVKAILGLSLQESVAGLTNLLSSVKQQLWLFRIVSILLDLGFNDAQITQYSLSTERADDGVIEILFHGVQNLQKTATVLSPVSNLQRQILQAIVKTDIVWEYRSNIFELHGLPGNRKGLANLIND